TEHDVDLVFDKIDLDNPVTEKVLELNKKHLVSAGETITIKGDNDTKLVLPSDLPSGVKLTITEVKNAKNLGELEKAGKVYSFIFEGLEGYNGTYELTMGVDKKFLANDYAASIYYHNQDKNQWEKIKSNVRNGK